MILIKLGCCDQIMMIGVVLNFAWLIVAFVVIGLFERNVYDIDGVILSSRMKSFIIMMGLFWPLWLPAAIIYAVLNNVFKRKWNF